MELFKVYDELKRHFINKKQENKTFYVVEEKDNYVVSILEKKALEVMLTEGKTVEEMRNCMYLSRLGWHEGNDKKIYEKFILSVYGNTFYNYANTQKMGKEYLKVLEDIKKFELPAVCDDKKSEISLQLSWFFKRNNISKIYKYEAKELKKTTVENKKDEEITL